MKRSWIIGIGILLLVSASPARAEAPKVQDDKPNEETPLETRINIGVKNTYVGWLLIFPLPLATQVSFDFLRFFRIQLDITANVLFHSGSQVGIAGGGSFSVYDARNNSEGSFQVKIPLLVDLGYIHANFEDGDYDADLNFFFLGPSTGADFTWWAWRNLGINVSLKAGYMFNVADMGSDYYPLHYLGGTNDDVGFFESSLVMGIAMDL